MTHFGGIDVGTWSTKMVVIDTGMSIKGSAVTRSGTELEASARHCLERASAGIDDVGTVIATGYGREVVPFATGTRTEISCHGRGAQWLAGKGEEMTVVDIGGQDSKIIRMSADGRIRNFKMNRKCAAGTGAFLEDAAMKMDVPLGELNEAASHADEVTELGSYCTVFTATEMLRRIREGATRASIAAGLFDSVAKRVVEMGPMFGKLVLTGGVVAHNPFFVERVKARVGTDVTVVVPEKAQFVGAFGAALFAAGSR